MRKLVIAVVVLFVLAAGGATVVYVVAPDDVHYSCTIGEEAICAFVHNGLIPGRACVRVYLHHRDGGVIYSAPVCSGRMIGDTYTVQPILGFPMSVVQFCENDASRCLMSVGRPAQTKELARWRGE